MSACRTHRHRNHGHWRPCALRLPGYLMLKRTNTTKDSSLSRILSGGLGMAARAPAWRAFPRQWSPIPSSARCGCSQTSLLINRKSDHGDPLLAGRTRLRRIALELLMGGKRALPARGCPRRVGLRRGRRLLFLGRRFELRRLRDRQRQLGLRLGIPFVAASDRSALLPQVRAAAPAPGPDWL